MTKPEFKCKGGDGCGLLIIFLVLWLQGCMLLLGFAIYCELTLYTEHKPGKWHPIPKVTITKETDPERAALECGPAPEQP